MSQGRHFRGMFIACRTGLRPLSFRFDPACDLYAERRGGNAAARERFLVEFLSVPPSRRERGGPAENERADQKLARRAFAHEKKRGLAVAYPEGIEENHDGCARCDIERSRLGDAVGTRKHLCPSSLF